MSNEPEPDYDLELAEALLLRLQGDRDGLESLRDVDHERAILLLPHFMALRQAARDAGREDLPELADDSVAIALGLVPGPDDYLSPARLKTARTRAGLKVGEFADRLRSRGWNVTTKAVFEWELKATQVAPAIITATGRLLGANPESLREPRVPISADPELVFDDAEVVIGLERWARASGKTIATVQTQLANTLVAAAARNRTTALDQGLVLKVLEVMRFLDTPHDGQKT